MEKMDFAPHEDKVVAEEINDQHEEISDKIQCVIMQVSTVPGTMRDPEARDRFGVRKPYTDWCHHKL